jgi:hypothetical protein
VTCLLTIEQFVSALSRLRQQPPRNNVSMCNVLRIQFEALSMANVAVSSVGN